MDPDGRHTLSVSSKGSRLAAAGRKAEECTYMNSDAS